MILFVEYIEHPMIEGNDSTIDRVSWEGGGGGKGERSPTF